MNRSDSASPQLILNCDSELFENASDSELFYIRGQEVSYHAMKKYGPKMPFGLPQRTYKNRSIIVASKMS